MEFNWPLVNLAEIEPEWLFKVMEETSAYNQIFDSGLPDNVDFTARIMVYVLRHATKDEIISYYFVNSQQLTQILEAQARIEANRSDEVRVITEIVETFYRDYRSYYKEQHM